MDKISTLMDGEFDGLDAEQQVARLRQAELRNGWDTFHVIRDTLRGEPVLSADFTARVASRLEAEPTVLAPRRRQPARRGMMYALSAAASVSAVAVVAWVALSVNPQIQTGHEIAAAPAAPPVAELVPVQGDGHMTGYLLAHQGVSPSTTIQGVAPYVRSVSLNATPQSR